MGNLRKSLELSEILQKQPSVREHAKSVKEDAEKEIAAKAICGKVMAIQQSTELSKQ